MKPCPIRRRARVKANSTRLFSSKTLNGSGQLHTAVILRRQFYSLSKILVYQVRLREIAVRIRGFGRAQGHTVSSLPSNFFVFVVLQSNTDRRPYRLNRWRSFFEPRFEHSSNRRQSVPIALLGGNQCVFGEDCRQQTKRSHGLRIIHPNTCY